MAADKMNGEEYQPILGKPKDRPILVVPREDSDSPDESEKVYQALRALFREMDEVRTATILMDKRMYLWPGKMRAIVREELDRDPVRQPSKSINDSVETIGADIIGKIDEYEKDKSTPPGPASKDVVDAIVKERVRIALLEKDAEKWRQVEAERKKAEEDRIALENKVREQHQALEIENRRSKNLAKWSIVTGSVTTLLGIIAYMIEHFHK